MKALAKATIIFALLPVFGAGVTNTDNATAQTIEPINTTTQVNLSDNGVLDINGGIQADSNLFHSFQTFNLEQQQTANFVVTPRTEAIIGQVIGGTISHIDGLIKVTGSNADFYLINPSGMLFGPNARLDLGGSFTATTATHLGNGDQWFEVLSNPDYQTFTTPPSQFGFSHPGTIVNQGQLFVPEGNSLRLLATQVDNTGTLSAPNGEISLLATKSGQTIHLGQTGGLLRLEIDADANLSETLPTLITGGSLTHSDAIAIDQNGDIALVPATTSNIQPSFNLRNAGNISTQGATGGEINLLGSTLQVTDSTLNASGDRGGIIRIGGAYQGNGVLPTANLTHITETTALQADGAQGNGGQVIVWADGTTIFDGAISAQSATGDGGLVETSGLHRLTIGDNATVRTASPQGSTGLWLLDPPELTVVDTGGLGIIATDINGDFVNDDTNSTIKASTIVNALNSTNVTLQANDAINVNAAINAGDNSISSNLLLDTATLNLNERITLQGSGQLSGTADTVNVGINGSIQNGVDAVLEGGTVNLAATTYREGSHITINHTLTLQGQAQDSTIISGDTDADDTGNHQVIKITSSADSSILTDLTIQDGLSTSNGAGLENDGDNVVIKNTTFLNNEVSSSNQDGGAIYNGGSLTLLNTLFENNRTGSDGGAIDIERGSVTVSDSSFINNQSNDHGGAIDVDPNGSLTISNSNFSHNVAGTEGGAIYLQGDTNLNSVTFLNNTGNTGGAIYTSDSAILNMEKSTLSNNQAQGNGGAIYISNNNSVSINESIIEDNITEASGGGIHNNYSHNVTISNTSILSNQALNSIGGGLNNLGNITLTNSTLEYNIANQGGGIFNGGSSLLTVTEGKLGGNQATSDGGGIYNNRGDIIITDSDFDHNIANRGGGLFDGGGTATINTVSFSSNQATRDGGGLYNQINTSSRITTGRFTNNSAHNGGGIYNRGELSLLDNIISSNQATGLGRTNGGAGILNTSGGSLNVDNSFISNNISASAGSGILNLASDEQTVVNIANSSIIGNQASTKGGGIANTGLNNLSLLADLTVTNSTISGNQAVTGGGIETSGPATLTNVTIAENIATSSGGGIAESSNTAEAPKLINTIVANNIAPTNPDVEGQFSDQGNNLIGINQGSTGLNLSNLVGTTNTPIDPGLTALNNNFGSLSHQLLADSPAINAGNNSVATASDQHGRARIVGATIDIGAVESTVFPDIIVQTNTSDPAPPIAPTVLINPTNPTSETPITQASTTESQEVVTALSNPQETLLENLTDPSLRDLNQDNIFNQGEKSEQALKTEQQSTTTQPPNGRLSYFDEEAFQYLEESFSKDYEEYWQLHQTPPVSLPIAQSILREANQIHQTETAIIYATFVPQATVGESSIERFVLPRTTHTPSPDDQLLLLLVSGNGDPVQQLINVSRTELIRQAKLFRLAASDPEDSISYKALARQMHNWLMAPLEETLATHNIEHVMYSLDQGLRTIPLAAMMQGDSFVIEQYGVSVVPSIGLTHLQIGNIEPQPRPLIAGADQFTELNDLPAVPIELDVVAQTLQSDDVLLNEAFTLDNFLKQQISQSPNMLHLATHAEFNTGNLNESFIQFWDAPLTFEQIKYLPWSELELLILSACNTAISSPDAELGFIGLAAAAGIETSMGSLWNVSDIGTLALMAEFYAQLPKTPLRSKVIQQAQISLLRGETQINNNTLHTSQGDVALPAAWNLETADFTHPFYWAGFTMVGNPWR